MDTSSTTTTSALSGWSWSCWNRPSPGLNSSILWMVFASRPVASDSFLAALPVGAASITLSLRASRMERTALRIVVFPVPGPPVMTDIFETLDQTVDIVVAADGEQALLMMAGWHLD